MSVEPGTRGPAWDDLADTGPLPVIGRTGPAHRGPVSHGSVFSTPRPMPVPRAAAGGARHTAPPPESGGGWAVFLALLVGSAVTVGIGAYARLHEPTQVALNIAGFSSGLAAKSWISTGAFALALVQLWSASVMYGRGRRAGGPPAWVAGVHRWSGRLAVLVTVPVVVHCLYAFGYQDGTLRVFVHSVAGCFFYGVFAAKMLVVGRARTPGWAIPVLGGLLFAVLAAAWGSSAVWFFTTSGFVL